MIAGLPLPDCASARGARETVTANKAGHEKKGRKEDSAFMTTCLSIPFWVGRSRRELQLAAWKQQTARNETCRFHAPPYANGLAYLTRDCIQEVRENPYQHC